MSRVVYGMVGRHQLTAAFCFRRDSFSCPATGTGLPACCTGTSTLHLPLLLDWSLQKRGQAMTATVHASLSEAHRGCFSEGYLCSLSKRGGVVISTHS